MSQSSFGPAPLPNLPSGFTPYAPAAMPAAAEASAPAPAAPSFGQPVGTPPFVAPSAPLAPHVTMNQPPHQGAPSFLSAAMPILAAVLAGGKDPRAIGEGLAAFQRGRQLKLAEQEHQQDRDLRTRTEQAEFYSRALEQAGTFDDPVAFEQWRSAIAPVAELHGINPAVFTFSDQKRAKALQVKAQAVMERLRKVYGADADDPAWQEAHSHEFDGYPSDKPPHVSEIARIAGQTPVKDLQGGLVGPTPKVTVPNTPEEQFYQTFAKEHGAKSWGDLSTALQREARKQWQTTNGAGAPNAGSFEDYIARYAKAKNKPVEELTTADIEDARKRFNQSDDKPTNTGTSEYRDFLMTDKLQQQWDKLTAPIRTMRQQYGVMQAGLDRFRNGDKNGGSQAVLVTFQKILDPTSVVRESEYARTTDGQAFLERIQGYATRLAKGGTTLSDAEMDEMVDTARQFLISTQAYAAGQKARMERTAAEFGINPALIFDDALTPPAERVKPNAGSPNTGSKPATGGFSVTASGKTYTFPTQAALDAFKADAGLK